MDRTSIIIRQILTEGTTIQRIDNSQLELDAIVLLETLIMCKHVIPKNSLKENGCCFGNEVLAHCVTIEQQKYKLNIGCQIPTFIELAVCLQFCQVNCTNAIQSIIF